jgi:hypothetical protein
MQDIAGNLRSARRWVSVVAPDAREYADLPWKAKLNCNCYALADSVRTCEVCMSSPSHFSLCPGHGATLEIQGKYITANLVHEIKEASFRAGPSSTT